MAPLHSSLGNKSETPSQKEKKKKKKKRKKSALRFTLKYSTGFHEIFLLISFKVGQ